MNTRRDRRGDEDRDRRRGDRSDPRDPTGREEARPRRPPLGEYFVNGDGIHREVMQTEIAKFLGPEATSRPAEHNGRRGYIIKALRPFTPDMIDDLKRMSRDYESEYRYNQSRGRDLPYAASETYQRAGPDPDDYDDGYPPPRSHVDEPGYSGNPAGSRFPDGRDGRGPYPIGTYPGVSSYSVGTYPAGVYPPGMTSGASMPGYPITVPAQRGADNYIYDPRDPQNPRGDMPGGYQVPGRSYDGAGQPRVLPPGYPYITSPSGAPNAGAPVDEAYRVYHESQVPGPPNNRGGAYAALPRGGNSPYEAPSSRYPTGPDPRDPYGGSSRRDGGRR